LTASADRWVAVLGEHHLKENDQHEVAYAISKIILFPDPEPITDALRPGIVQNDIALVKLAQPAQLDQYVQIGCLPYPNEVFKAGQRCSVAGWGVTEEERSYARASQAVRLIPREMEGSDFRDKQYATPKCITLSVEELNL
uniref:Peptidase S1 domain-containing protein n=1 Tax=Echinostoma caproni TaxID=27848 RepID=A0A183ABE6_9TREM